MSDDKIVGAGAPDQDNDLFLDLDAFAPSLETQKTVRFKGQTHPVLSLLDLPIKHAMEVLRVGRELEGKPLAEQMERARRQIELLVPDFKPEHLDALSARQIVALAAHAVRAAGRPQSADENP